MSRKYRINWAIGVVDEVLEDLKRRKVIKYLGKGKEYHLDCFGLKGNTRFKADRAVVLEGQQHAVFIEIDKEGWYDHNVVKYWPYLEQDPMDLKDKKDIRLLHLIVKNPKGSENNYLSSWELSGHYAGLIASKHPRFKYKRDKELFKEKKSVDALGKDLEKLILFQF